MRYLEFSKLRIIFALTNKFSFFKISACKIYFHSFVYVWKLCGLICCLKVKVDENPSFRTPRRFTKNMETSYWYFDYLSKEVHACF